MQDTKGTLTVISKELQVFIITPNSLQERKHDAPATIYIDQAVSDGELKTTSEQQDSSSDERSNSYGTSTLSTRSGNGGTVYYGSGSSSTMTSDLPKPSLIQKLFMKLHLTSDSSNTPQTQQYKGNVTYLRKYGTLTHKKLGEGVSATVRLIRKDKETFAVKIFHKYRKNEDETAYMKLMAGEYCISYVMDHENIVRTFDFVPFDERLNKFCIVMEYCTDGDVYSLIKSRKLEDSEVYSYFKQLMFGLEYLHNLGVAHRDLKPENLLLKDGKLKISDFGAADVFRVAWQDHSRLSDGLVGTPPYMAPEVFGRDGYWGAPVDIWSAGIVLYCMMFNSVPFGSATRSDLNYLLYVRQRPNRNFQSFNKIDPEPRHLIYSMLNPCPERRIDASDILAMPWVKSIMP